MRRGTAQRIAFGCFLFLTASLALQKPSIVSFAGNELSVTDLTFPLVLLAASISFLAGGRRFEWRPVHWLFTAYSAAFVIASLFSTDQTRAFVKTAATIYLVLIAVLTIEIVDTWERLKLTILTFVAASAIPVAIGLATIVLFYMFPESNLIPSLTSHYGSVPVGHYPRLSSTFVSASMFCNYLNMLVVLLLAARAMKWISFRAIVPALAATAACASFTISSGLGAVILAIGMWLWLRSRSETSGRLVFAIAIGICLLFFTTGFVALQKHSTAPYSTILPLAGIEVYPSPRLLVWTDAANAFLNNVFVGRGPGARSAEVVFQNTDGSFSLLTDAHNMFLSVATQTGLLGLLPLIALTIYLLKVGFRRLDDPLIAGLTVALLSAFVVQGLMGSFEDARHLWLLIGLLVAAFNIEKETLPAELGGSA